MESMSRRTRSSTTKTSNYYLWIKSDFRTYGFCQNCYSFTQGITICSSKMPWLYEKY